MTGQPNGWLLSMLSRNVIAVHVEWGMIRFVDFSRNSHDFRFLSIESNQPFAYKRINILRKF
jgi:hypothetical protein